MLTQERLKELLYYNPETGEFKWRVVPSNRRVKRLTIAGVVGGDGIRRIQIDKQLHTAKRLAFLYMKGAMPMVKIFSLDGNPGNTKWGNLVLNAMYHPKYRRDNEEYNRL